VSSTSRPPYGEDAERFDRVGAELGLGPTVLWSVDPRDWEAERDVIVERVLAAVEPGSIVDLHDGRRAQEGTIEALEIVLPALKARGLVPVTVSQLLA
jgi:peptidoglycan/xylan/chitin deacetylase (PgdA/CDA1 family)